MRSCQDRELNLRVFSIFSSKIELSDFECKFCRFSFTWPRKAHALAWWAFQPGHQVLCQGWSREKIERGCLIANCRMGQSAQWWTFSMMKALQAMFPRSGLN